MNPMPVPEDLGLAYQNYFTHESGAESNLRKICLWGYDVASWIASLVTGLHPYKQLSKNMYLGDLKPGKLLDVGCGDGRFLNDIRQQGWHVNGVEVDPKAVEAARKKYNLDVFAGNLFSAQFESNSFDAITLRHVIEHLTDPVKTLEECRRLLKSNGRLVVVTPNASSWGHGVYGRHWLGLDQPRHLMIFSPAAIELCAQMAGFKSLAVKTSPANAETVFAISISLTMRSHHAMDLSAGPEFGRALRAVIAQHQEAMKMKENPLIGEELVLLASK
jgi:2-polyprenyl-3-methyl-5-hydroxy-6-metoxy-1,4-benzoquinol methylase